MIPPVSGGAYRVTEEPLSLEAVVAEVADERAGGVATFTGTFARQSRGREVRGLEYEAYTEMAEEVMAHSRPSSRSATSSVGSRSTIESAGSGSARPAWL